MTQNGSSPRHNTYLAKYSKDQVKTMVKGVVQHLENLHDDLDEVIGDIKDLVADIENVTDKVERHFAGKSIDDNELNTRTPLPSISEIDEKENVFTDFKVVDESPDLDLSYLQINPGLQRPKWGRSLSQPVSRTPAVTPQPEVRCSWNATSIIKDIDSIDGENLDQRPVARCFAQYKRKSDSDFNYRIRERIYSLPSTISVASDDSEATYKEIVPRTNADVTEKQDVIYKSICQPSTSTLNRFSKENDLSSTLVSDVFQSDTQTVETLCTCRNIKEIIPSVSSSPSVENAGSDVSYERDMEHLLENLVEVSSQSGLSDCDMENESFGKTHSLLSDAIEVPFDDDVNTWKSYALTHVSTSTKSSDSFLSDTPSDILNDNTRATSVYGNMIFSDNLVVLPSKHRKCKEVSS